MNEDAWLESWGKIPTLRPDDWLGGECWSIGTPSVPEAKTDKTEILKDLLFLSVRLDDLATELDRIRERLERL